MKATNIPWYQPVPTPLKASMTRRFAVWGRNFFALPSEHRYTTIALRALACTAIVPPLLALVGNIVYLLSSEETLIPQDPPPMIKPQPYQAPSTVYKPPSIESNKLPSTPTDANRNANRPRLLSTKVQTTSIHPQEVASKQTELPKPVFN